MCTKEQIQEAKKYLGEQGYGTGSNFTVNAVANLMAEWLAKNCTMPVVTNRNCSNCHHCVVNTNSENEHDQYKCFAREHITTISNINNYVCDKWTSL